MEPLSIRAPSRPARRRAGWIALAPVLGVALAVATLAGCGGAVASTAFRREAAGEATADPFAPSVGHDRAGVVPPAHVGGRYVGTTPGLYGGSDDGGVCDPAALARYLGADPVKAEAWAGVLGIDPAGLGAYFTRLTPVLLRTDTAVTNHGFAAGKVTDVPAVLQAGTAVLVDERGVPVVKCGCGNPLTPPPSDHARYEGAGWNGFAPGAVATVLPAPEPVASLVIADGGSGAVRPVGTTGARDTPYVAGAGVSLTSGRSASVGVATPAATGAPASGDDGSDPPGSDYPGSVASRPDYPVHGTGADTMTYGGTYPGPANGGGSFLSEDCLRAGYLDRPFTVTLHVRDGGAAEVRVVGSGSADGAVAIGQPLPSVDLGDAVSPEGSFSAGAGRTYDTSTHEGAFSARWSGNLGVDRPLPDQLPVTIRQSWRRNPDFVTWLPSSGGPSDFSCAFDVTVARQA